MITANDRVKLMVLEQFNDKAKTVDDLLRTFRGKTLYLSDDGLYVFTKALARESYIREVNVGEFVITLAGIRKRNLLKSHKK